MSVQSEKEDLESLFAHLNVLEPKFKRVQTPHDSGRKPQLRELKDAGQHWKGTTEPEKLSEAQCSSILTFTHCASAEELQKFALWIAPGLLYGYLTTEYHKSWMCLVSAVVLLTKPLTAASIRKGNCNTSFSSTD